MMPTLFDPALHPQHKPHPLSHDSGEEHSLGHWLEVYWLVEEDYLFAKDADAEAPMIDAQPPKHAAKSAVPHRKSAPHR
jgi:hypothetical protein